MPVYIQEDRNKTLEQKFEECTYWEILDPSFDEDGGSSVRWSSNKIRTIDSILEVGITTHDNDSISQHCMDPNPKAYIKFKADRISLSTTSHFLVRVRYYQLKFV